MKYIQVAVAIVGIIGIGWIFFSRSFAYDTEVVQGFEAPPQKITIEHTKPLVVSLLYPEQYIFGVVLYAADEQSADTLFDVTLRDKKGVNIATKKNQYTQYRKSGDPVITVLLSRHDQIKPKQEVSLVITPRAGKVVTLRTVESGTLVFSTLHTKPVSFGTKQGVLIGSALGLAILLLWLARGMRMRYQWGIAVGIIILGAFLVTLPYTYRPSAWGINDWDYHHSLSHIYQQTIRQYHELPLWNPYFCGGTAALGDPEFAVFTPYFILQYLFGVESGTGYALLFCFAITGIGVMVLGKYLGLLPFEATFASIIVLCSSALVLKASEGHTPIIFAYMWVPWVFWAWLQKRALLCGVFLALMLLQGGVYILSYTALSFIALTILRKNKLRAFRVSLFAGLWMIGLSGFQLIPTLYWLKEYQDEAFVSSTYTLNNLPDIFFGRYLHHTFILKNQVSDWHEYGAYIGYGVLLLVVLGASYYASRKTVRILLLGTVLTILVASVGPIFSSFVTHIPYIPRSNISRIILFTLLSGSLLAGFGMKRLIQLSSRAWAVPVLLAGFICIDLASLAYPIAEQGFSVPRVTDALPTLAYPIAYTPETFSIRQQGLDMPRAYAATLQGYGTSSFCNVVGPKSAVAQITTKNPHPPFITSGPDTDVKLLYWSQNTIKLSVNTKQESDIGLNANYAPGWRTSAGFIYRNKPRLTLQVPSGDREITLWYHPPGMHVGLLVSGVSFVIALSLMASGMKGIIQVRY